MTKRWVIGLVLLWLAGPAWGDHFDDHSADVLLKAASSPGVKQTRSLTGRQLAAAPHPLIDASACAFVVVKTGQGNWCKLLLRSAQRKLAGRDQPLQLVLVERLVTYAAGPRQRVAADEANVYLFDGFALDLDIGKIVPPGADDDLQFAQDDQGGKVSTVGDAAMFLVGQPLVAPSRSNRLAFSQGAVQPEDFAGTYSLEADGRWRAEIVLKVSEDGLVTGTYQSQSTGQAYDLTGKVGSPANHIVFEVTFPQTVQKFDGYLWTHDRNRMSGITYMLDQPFGFHAERKR